MPGTVIDPRELDVRVARKVYKRDVMFLAGFEDEEMDSSSNVEMGWYEIEDGGKDFPRTVGRMVPFYSQDVATAQEICEDFPVTVESDGTGKYRWVRSRILPGETERVIGEWEGGMGMAICHGALEYAKTKALAETAS